MRRTLTKTIAIGAVAVVIVGSLVLLFWVRSVFVRDTVRATLESQIASAIGQPVSIKTISASIFPRVTVTLGGVSIGNPVRIHATTLRFGTDLRALFSRQIVHGTVRVDGAHVDLPLPSFEPTNASTSTHSSRSAIEIVSIDTIVLNDIAFVSGGRTLRADVEAVPHGAGVTLRNLSLSADDVRLTGVGELRSLVGPVGEISLEARSLNLASVLDLAAAFSAGSGTAAQSSRGQSRSSAQIDLTVSVRVERAVLGTLVLDKASARAAVGSHGIALSPVEFGLFGGGYKGTIEMPSASSALRMSGALSNVDVAGVMAFAGSPGALSGRLGGQLAISGSAADPTHFMNAVRGTARLDIRNGVVKGLGLVKTIVIATSGRADARSQAPGESSDEPFSRLSATLALANGTAHTQDLQFESSNVLMNAAGSFRLNGSAIDLKGDVQLSEALSQQAGRDLLRYTQQQGRVTLPVTITGTAQAPSVWVDMATATGRALQKQAKEAIKRTLDGLLRR